VVERSRRVEELTEHREDGVARDERGDQDSTDHDDAEQDGLSRRRTAGELLFHHAVGDASYLNCGSRDHKYTSRDARADDEPDEDCRFHGHPLILRAGVQA
jgi:hypothetical protein